MIQRNLSCIASYALLICMVIVGCGQHGPVKHQVTGTVLVNDEPAEGVVVSLRHTSVSVKGNAVMPVGVTNPRGVFVLSTDKDEDGAVEGEYVVTFVWPPTNSPDGDRLGWKYSEMNTSHFRLKIPAPGGVVEPFRLQDDSKGRKR